MSKDRNNEFPARGNQLTRPGELRLEQLTDPNWKSQLEFILDRYGHTGAQSFESVIGVEAQRNRRDALHRVLELIAPEIRLSSLSQLTPVHINRIVQLWVENKISSRVRANYYTHLRWFWRLFGVEVPSIAKFEPEMHKGHRTANTNSRRSWAGKGISFDDVHALLQVEDQVAAHFLVYMRESGLPFKEYIGAQGKNSGRSVYWNIADGHKKKEPFNPVNAIFDEASYQSFLRSIRDSVGEPHYLLWSRMTLNQAQKRMIYLAKKVGLTRDRLGVTLKDLRGDFVRDEFTRAIERMPGVADSRHIDYRTLARLRMKLFDTSSGKPDVGGAFLGRFPCFDKSELARFLSSWETLNGLLPEIRHSLVASGVRNLYWIETRAMGHGRSTAQPFEFLFHPGVDPLLVSTIGSKIADIVTSATGINCNVHAWCHLGEVDAARWREKAIPLILPIAPNDMAAVGMPSAAGGTHMSKCAIAP